MTKISALLITLSFAFAFQTDTVKYVKKMDLSFNLNSTTISDNWYKGGNSTLNWQLDAVYNFISDSKKYNLTNTGKFSFGKSEIDGIPNKSRVTSNEFKHETTYTHKLGLALEPFISASILTQVAPGYSYKGASKTKGSDIFDPGYFTQAIGVGYTSKDLFFNARGGFALKETISTGDTLAVAITDDSATGNIRETTNVDMGLKLNASYKKTFKKFEIITAVEIFTELKSIKETDVLFDFTIISNITDYLRMSFDFDLRYDIDIHKSHQTKHILSIGLVYSFF